MSQDLMLYFGALSLGALHAFEPGHGKTLIAAYMIGTRGRAIDGILLGLIVTFTHTFSVIVLGIIARLLSHTYTETQLHTWMGFFSSLLILAVGLWMLRQRLGGHSGHHHFHLFGRGHHHDHGQHHHDDHAHDHGHDHEHEHEHDHGHAESNSHHHHEEEHDHGHDHGHGHDHDHDHDHAHPHTDQGQPAGAAGQVGYSKMNLLLLGVSGGLIPCPAAIATLLAAIAAGRVAQGLTLAIFFSLGLGLVMMTIGVILSHAGKFTEKLGVGISGNQEFSRRMGIASAMIITALGSYTLYHSIVAIMAPAAG